MNDEDDGGIFVSAGGSFVIKSPTYTHKEGRCKTQYATRETQTNKQTNQPRSVGFNAKLSETNLAVV